MLIIKAVTFAAIKHKDQERKSTGLPYVIHPIIVSYLIAKYKGTSKDLESLQVAALLHDVLEDTECDFMEIEREFNPLVASLVFELTSDPVMIARIGKAEYIKLKMSKMTKYSFILKLVDRLSNVSDNPKDQYVQDTIDLMHYLFANREDVTERQTTIMNDILQVCADFQDAAERKRSMKMLNPNTDRTT